MISTEEFNNINTGLSQIKFSINKMLEVINLIESKNSIISEILTTRFSSTSEKFSKKTLSLQKDKLIYLSDKFDQLSDISLGASEQYKAFLLSNIVPYHSNNKHLLDEYSTKQLTDFINKQNLGTPSISPEDSSSIDWLHYLPDNYYQYIGEIENLFSMIFIFNQINNIDGNIVMIGANGSGKSTFARQLNGTLSNNIVILSAQHFLYYTKRQNISASGDEITKVRDFHRNSKLSSDTNFTSLITSDMNDLVNALVSEYADRAFECYESGNKQESYLSKTISLWDSIIEHRNLKNDRSNLYVTGSGISSYDFNQLSDGEKAVFYYIGHILLAQKNSYIIIDEPENHLHLTICNKLWDLLEQNRPDCKFIYLTHNLNFATTRTDSTILWNKSFSPPAEWNFELLPTNEVIPEVLIMELVGSRKNICFCEGNNRSSIDYKLYSILFPTYTIIPVSGHRDVIDYVDAYNSTSSFITNAVGIIDGDYHLKAQIEKWSKKKVFTLPINEIENILCDDFILSYAIEHFCASPDALEKFHTEFWKLLNENRTQQATSYVNNYINSLFKDNFLHEKSNVSALIEELTQITTTEKVNLIYDEILTKIDDFLTSGNYNSAIQFVNIKKRLTRELAKKFIVDNYENRILDLIKKEPQLKQHILNTYFSEFPF